MKKQTIVRGKRLKHIRRYNSPRPIFLLGYEDDRILPCLRLPNPCPITILWQGDTLRLHIGPRDWDFSLAKVGPSVGSGTIVSKRYGRGIHSRLRRIGMKNSAAFKKLQTSIFYGPGTMSKSEWNRAKKAIASFAGEAVEKIERPKS